MSKYVSREEVEDTRNKVDGMFVPLLAVLVAVAVGLLVGPGWGFAALAAEVAVLVAVTHAAVAQHKREYPDEWAEE